MTLDVRFTPTGRRRVETVSRRLERFPRSGRLLPEFPDLPYREVIVSPYRFFYRGFQRSRAAVVDSR